MRPRRQANSIRLEAQDLADGHQLVAQRRLNSLPELIRELIREAAKGASAPKVPPSIADLAERLDASVDGTMAVAGELLGAFRPQRSTASWRMRTG